VADTSSSATTKSHAEPTIPSLKLFTGQEVVIGVQARNPSQEEQAYIVLPARTFTSSTRVEVIPEVISGYADSNLLTMLHAGRN
jgi:hypothetical protein